MPSGSVSWQALRSAPPARAVTGWGRAAGGSRWQAGRSCGALCWGPGPWVYPRGTAPGVTWCCGGSAQRLQAERPRRDCACAARHLVPWPWRGWIGPLQTGMPLSPSVWQGLALATSFEGTVPSPVLPVPLQGSPLSLQLGTADALHTPPALHPRASKQRGALPLGSGACWRYPWDVVSALRHLLGCPRRGLG